MGELGVVKTVVLFFSQSPGWAALLLLLSCVLLAIALLIFEVYKSYKASLKTIKGKEAGVCGSNCPLNTEKSLIVLIDTIQKRINNHDTITNEAIAEKINKLKSQISEIECLFNDFFPILNDLIKTLSNEIIVSKDAVTLLKDLTSKEKKCPK